ncbi:MAG: 23S rRNA (pseudouridine(1915)-N(3))-methyltransferase RlmH [Firmicutes bacterium]|nr:23S rRNA (pseudouridine(1915)-N(3))-methyltransferase RlmH [Bacillota bacterium]
MNIRIIAVGKLKEKYLEMGINEYLKRLQTYAKVEIVEVKEESFSEPLSEKSSQQILEREGKRILDAIPEKYYVIALDRLGKQQTSEELSNILQELAVYGQGNIALIIGGSLGLSSAVLEKADLKLSFSKFTFPHQLMRLILVEQIYRALTIIRGEKYHK